MALGLLAGIMPVIMLVSNGMIIGYLLGVYSCERTKCLVVNVERIIAAWNIRALGRILGHARSV